MARESFGLTDRDWLYLSGAIVVLVMLWWVWRKSQPVPQETPAEASGALPVQWDEPMGGVYDANPQAYMPQTPADLTLNVNANNPNMLSNAYIPMFGFVGVAQGEAYD